MSFRLIQKCSSLAFKIGSTIFSLQWHFKLHRVMLRRDFYDAVRLITSDSRLRLTLIKKSPELGFYPSMLHSWKLNGGLCSIVMGGRNKLKVKVPSKAFSVLECVATE